jgi:hypothetical protein
MNLKDKIKEVGTEIQPKLNPKPGFPKRNAYAHLFGMIKAICGVTYSEAEEAKVLAIVEAIRINPNGSVEEIQSELDNHYQSSERL